MARVLVTGAGGILGRSLIPLLEARGDQVLALVRSPTNIEGADVVIGDVAESDLGISTDIGKIDALYHLAGITDLGESKAEQIWKVNRDGTANALAFAKKRDVPHFYFVSTAYTFGRNSYEKSKEEGEKSVRFSTDMKITIFRPSIFVADSITLEGAGAFYQFIFMMAKVHRRLEILRRGVEEVMRLPSLEPVFRIRGNGDGYLNLVPVDAVAHAISEITDTGTYYLTNPHPPKLKDLAQWVGEVILLNIQFSMNFTSNPIETLFHRAVRPFLPYLQGDDLLSNLPECPPTDKEFIQESILKFLLR